MPQKKPRRTLLKIRAVPLVRMPKSHFFELIKDACQNGVIPPDIEITTLNWDHATGQRYQPGQVLSAKHRQELRNCYKLLTNVGSVRVETPE